MIKPEKETGAVEFVSENEELIVACCGLCCSNCGMHKKGKCQGCHHERPIHRNCQIKACVYENGFSTCAECLTFTDLKQCGKLHNLVSRFLGLIFGTNRIGSLYEIRSDGLGVFKGKRQLDGKK